MNQPHQPMNYRHAYHAGNFADVVKHAVLVALIDALTRKATPFAYIDSHAGRGSYALDGAEARATDEARGGVLDLLRTGATTPAALERYVALVRGFNPDQDAHAPTRYPGSPMLVRAMVRQDDALVLCELEPGEAAALRESFRHDARVHVHQRDGYQALGALLPPAQKRGLVLIDPPFEAQEGEFRRIEDALDAALARWPQGIYAIWYPIKRDAATKPFHRRLRRFERENLVVGEFFLRAPISALRLNGCGMAIVNAPWRFETALAGILDAIRTALAPQAPPIRIEQLGSRA